MATTRLLSAMVATWNNVATTFTGLKLNVTDTASASGSLLMDLQAGGASKFKVDKTGQITSPNGIVTGNVFGTGTVGSNSNTGTLFLGSNADVTLARDAANALALRNGTAGQAFRVYKTYTDGSNYERGSWYTDVNGFHLETQSAGTGTSQGFYVGTVGAASLNFQTNNSTRWYVGGSDGHFVSPTDNTYDIGASGANRPRNVYVGTQVVAPTFFASSGYLIGATGYAGWTGRTTLKSTADGVLRLLNNAETNSVDLTVGASNLLTLNGGLKTTGATFALQTATTLTDNAAAQVATMTNGPTAGNPTKWIAINDNGVTRYIPCW